MIFSELYGAYYNTVAMILKEATEHPVDKNRIRAIIEKSAFAESVLNIEPAFEGERWQLLYKDGTTPLCHPPSMPLTDLQKRWLKAISLDPRIKLFDVSFPDFTDIQPLFTQDDIYIFDKYADGDPYEDKKYIKHFRIILEAIKNHKPLRIDMLNKNNNTLHSVVMPEYLEYSEKDDKFRLICYGSRYMNTVNLAKVVNCRPYTMPFEKHKKVSKIQKMKTVEFELTDRRNAMERVLLHFAHFEKEAEKLDENRYKVEVIYDKSDETELVIRILSFGPMIKVTSPQSFIDLIKERLKMQKSCGL